MKKLMKKYGHVWILSYGLIYLPWFAALQQNVGKPYHVMHTALDDLIPFNEYFIVPYLLWFLYVAAAIAYFFFTSKDDYYRLCTFLFTGMTISLLVCTLYPNGTDFRPAIDPDKNIFCFLVAKLWSIDPCINVFHRGPYFHLPQPDSFKEQASGMGLRDPDGVHLYCHRMLKAALYPGCVRFHADGHGDLPHRLCAGNRQPEKVYRNL